MMPVKRKQWWRIQRKDVIGLVMFSVGLGIFLGWLLTDKVHGWEKWAFGFALIFMVFGAHLMSSDPVERAVTTVVNGAKKVLPKRSSDD